MGALTGITVLEFANYVSGPYAGMMLADLGAEVIKIEPPGGGDPFRGWGAADYSATFGSVNRNKKSIILDLKTPDGIAAARALASKADVLIENFRPGAMERLGLDYAALRQSNPRLIYVSITGFGSSGPYADRAGYDTVGQAMSGLLSVLTDLSNPEPMGISLSDHLTGMMAAYGVLGALMARERSGRGQRVETSLLAATIAFLGENAARFFETGNRPTRETRARSAQVYAFTDSERRGFVVHLSSPAKFWQRPDACRRPSRMAGRSAVQDQEGPAAELSGAARGACRDFRHARARALACPPARARCAKRADLHAGRGFRRSAGEASGLEARSAASETRAGFAGSRRRHAERDACGNSQRRAGLRTTYRRNSRAHRPPCARDRIVIEPAKRLRNRCAIAGAGNSRLGQVPGVSSLDLFVEAAANALEDAGLKPVATSMD